MAWDKIKKGTMDLASKGLDASKDLAEKRMELSKEKKAQKKQEKQDFKDRIKQMDKEGVVYCSKCYSTDITGNKRGWKITTGMIGRNKIINTCMNCGHKWKAGKK